MHDIRALHNICVILHQSHVKCSTHTWVKWHAHAHLCDCFKCVSGVCSACVSCVCLMCVSWHALPHLCCVRCMSSVCVKCVCQVCVSFACVKCVCQVCVSSVCVICVCHVCVSCVCVKCVCQVCVLFACVMCVCQVCVSFACVMCVCQVCVSFVCVKNLCGMHTRICVTVSSCTQATCVMSHTHPHLCDSVILLGGNAAAWHTYARVVSMPESCRSHARIAAWHTVCMSHVAYVNESWHTQNAPCHTHA